MMPVPTFYTLREVAARIRKSPRWLRDHLRTHPVEHRRAGRELLFTEAAVLQIIATFEVVGPSLFECPTPRRKPRLALSPDTALEEALRLARERKPPKRPRRTT